jgi:hypothetical protein
MNEQMIVNNLVATVNMPPALKSTGAGETEVAHALPPYSPQPAYLVDEYPACPDSWLRSTGRIKSYFVAIRPKAGLWLDFNACLLSTANHVAIVVSVQGVNAISGLPCKDASLEQYRDKCPKHKEDFGPDRLCKKCGYKWPRGNYLSSTGQPSGMLWLDGFRAEDGVVRQYVFTSKEIRGVAANVIGKDRVYALGISFFLSKELRPKPVITLVEADETDSDEISYGSKLSKSYAFPTASKGGSKGLTGSPMPRSASYMSKKIGRQAGGQSVNSVQTYAAKVAVEQLEIAAGARIDQRVYDDPNGLDFWCAEPEGVLVLNYATEKDCESILAAGKIDLSGSKEGFMQNIPTGN